MTTHQLIKHSSETMDEIRDNSVHLVVTSPPYGVGKPYGDDPDNDIFTEDAYELLLSRVFGECYRVLVQGGRIAVNVANLDRNPYRPLINTIYKLLVRSGFSPFGEVIWHKWDNANTTAWGSWLSDSSPYLRDTHEYIIIARKGEEPMESTDGEYSLSKEEFLTVTNSVWKILPANHSVHPAVFPDEIPRRLIKLFTREGCTVLDPFGGSGTTARVSKELDRNSITFEIQPRYWQLIEEFTEQADIRTWFETPLPNVSEITRRS